ncbi:MAG: hypothetical protein JNM31_15470 [Flavobacteriales bacterium]|nr:hypothetical protein [Flavobacteriales bacterium]
MRHSLPILSGSLFLFTLNACTPEPQESDAYLQLKEDYDRLQAADTQQDSAVNALFSAMGRIGDNLRSIQAGQGRLTVTGPDAEQGVPLEERILNDIRDIDAKLRENQELIERMKKQAKGSSARINELDKAVAAWEQLVREKDGEIEQLKEQLTSSNKALAAMMDLYRDRVQQVGSLQEELNTAWYAIGTEKELRANGVLTKEGGVAGIGARTKLNAESLAKDYFRSIDVEQTPALDLAGRKPRLITPHPSSSYRFEPEGAQLVITDKDAFWSLSRYLVVVVE